MVSVGIPCYNRPEGLRRTLECITGQTYTNLEIIVSDNCSPESEIEAIVCDFIKDDDRIHYYRQDENRGSSFNFKFVLEKATGKYFMWAADDDEWEPNFISFLLDFLIRNTDIAVVMSGMKRIDDFNNVVDIIRYKELSNQDYSQFKLSIFAAGHDIIAYYIYGLFRTTEAKKFYFNIDNSYGKDVIIACELVLSTKLGYIDELLFINHIHPEGVAKRYSQEEIGRSYADPLNYLKLFLNLGPYLLSSPNIPVKRKLWVPFMVLRRGMFAGRLYVRRICAIIYGRGRKIYQRISKKT